MDTTLLSRLLSVARTVTPVSPVPPVAATLPQLEIGQSVRALIVGRLADGSFRVEIGNTALRLALPSGTQPGDVLSLRVVALAPRLQFELLPTGAASKPQVSSAGRLIGQLISETVAAPTRQPQPIVEAPSTEARAWHAPLARAVERSGLFYESHQARWIRGNFRIEHLREEPQAAIGKNRQTAPAAAESAARQARTSLVTVPATRPELAPHAHDAGKPQISGATPIAASASEEIANGMVAPETLPIVRQQLETLETRHFGWQGELWPGQFMQWEIAEQAHDERPDHGQNDWATRLALTLPALGEIDAVLCLSAQGIGIALRAQDPSTAQSMRTAAPELIRALEAAGLKNVTLQVRQDERAG